MLASHAHMNDYYIPLDYWLNRMGFETVTPPKPNRRSFEFGLEHSPEFVCLPFKVNLGDYKNAADMGATDLFMTTDYGPCRYGYYGYVSEVILKRLGIDVKMHVFYHGDVMRAYRFFKGFHPRMGFFKFLNCTLEMFRLAEAIEHVDERTRMLRPFQKTKGEADRVKEAALAKLRKVDRYRDLKPAMKEIDEMFDKVAVDASRDPIRLGHIGEIYVVLEPFVNADIERLLGDLGVEVHRQLCLSQYLYHQLNFRNYGVKGERQIHKRAHKYCPKNIGAHGQQTIADAMLFKQWGLDGVVHVYPFTCMPEITAYTMLRSLSRNEDFPSISFTMDQHTGRAGIQTRLEAFLDMLEKRREARARPGDTRTWAPATAQLVSLGSCAGCNLRTPCLAKR